MTVARSAIGQPPEPRASPHAARRAAPKLRLSRRPSIRCLSGRDHSVGPGSELSEPRVHRHRRRQHPRQRRSHSQICRPDGLLVSEPDSGQMHRAQQGVARATGAILAWINSDDKYCPWAFNVVGRIFFSRAASQLLTSPDTAAVEPRRPLQTAFHTYPMRAPGFYRAGPSRLSHSARAEKLDHEEATFWRRELWRPPGGRWTRAWPGGDFELWARFYEHADLVTTTLPAGRVPLSRRPKINGASQYQAEALTVLAHYGAARFTTPRCMAAAPTAPVYRARRPALRQPGRPGWSAPWNATSGPILRMTAYDGAARGAVATISLGPGLIPGAVLEATLKSIHRSELSQLEYIVIDGGSTTAARHSAAYANRLTDWVERSRWRPDGRH